MAENKLRQLIKSGRFAMGMTVNIPDPRIVELAAYAGFDFILPRMHERMGELVRAAEAAQIPVLPTIAGGTRDPHLIGNVLDLGADGLTFALVSSRQQAENIVRLCKIPPMGDRENTGSRVRDKYRGISGEEYTRLVNDAVIVVKIESKEGLEHAEEILSVPGIDVVKVGKMDLSQSLGVEEDSPVVLEAQQHVIKLAKSAGVAVMTSGVRTPEEVGEWIKREESLRLFQLTGDTTLIDQGCRGWIRRCKELVA